MNKIEAKLTKKDIIIRIPIDLLVFAHDNNPDIGNFFQVKCKRKWAQELVDYILDGGGDSETGLTGLQEFFDNAFGEIIANGSENVKELEEDDEDDE